MKAGSPKDSMHIYVSRHQCMERSFFGGARSQDFSVAGVAHPFVLLKSQLTN